MQYVLRKGSVQIVALLQGKPRLVLEDNRSNGGFLYYSKTGYIWTTSLRP